MEHVNNCLLCGNGESLPYYGFGAPDKILVSNRICEHCGLVFQSPRFDPDELRRYYESYMSATQPQIADIPPSFEEHIIAISRLRLQYLEQFLKDGDRVLDIGCSFGAMLKVLRDESGLKLSLTGVNPENSLSGFGRRNYKLDIRTGLFEDMDLPAGGFDFIIVDNVFEHFYDPKQTAARMRRLLDKDGLLFIATNNLDEPHGFLWRNFFLDHTATFSPITLRALLESRGFKIVSQDTNGHVTYEGYHYPYQYCVAVKSEIPAGYDFAANGEKADAKIRMAKKHIKDYYKTGKYEKILHELKLNKAPSPAEKRKIHRYETLARQKGQTSKFRVLGHTLPPEEFFFRRILVAECATDADADLAYHIAQNSRLNPIVFILRNTREGKLALGGHPADVLHGQPPHAFDDRAAAWRWIAGNFQHVSEGIAVRLSGADLKSDVLARYREKFLGMKEDYANFDLRQFTQARIEFLTAAAINGINGGGLDGALCASGKGDYHGVAWPSREDYRYYYKDRFKKYYRFPKSISFDLNPSCNKRCGKCQFHSPESPFAGSIMRDETMPLELAFRMLDEAAKWDPKPAIAPTFSGEPLLYPHLKEFIKYAKGLGFAVSVTTNGSLLIEEAARFLIDSGVDSILISLDAADPGTYSRLQEPGDFELTRGNILSLPRMRGTRSKPGIGVHFVTDERNQAQFETYLGYWADKVDFVSRAIRQDQFSVAQLTLPPFFKLGKRQACFAPWQCMYIRWNGDISFCGFDIDGKTSGLNVKERSLEDIWNSEEYWKFRDVQIEGKVKEMYCKACPDWAGQRSINRIENGRRASRTPFTEVYTRIK
ncbi:MAG: methyltransferase domain-containing protein [Nitrospinae bacterium]|nr:methyltransferase domain-containing protein [Nitrospinota bacterium]